MLLGNEKKNIAQSEKNIKSFDAFSGHKVCFDKQLVLQDF